MKKNTLQHSAFKALSKHLDSLLAEEGITPEILDYVDLDVACSPVIVVCGESIRDAVTVQESEDPNKFLLSHPGYPAGFVTRDSLKIMRARYLLARNGPPNPNPIATFDTTTEKGREECAKFMGALGKVTLHMNQP